MSAMKHLATNTRLMLHAPMEEIALNNPLWTPSKERISPDYRLYGGGFEARKANFRNL